MAMQSGFIKRIRDIMRMDAGINGDAQRIEQMVWMLFLKVYDAKEDDWELNEDNYESIIPEDLRWRNWAKPDDSGKAMTGDKLLDFVNTVLFPVLKGNDVKDGDTIIYEGIKVTPDTSIKKAIVKSTFEDANNYMKDGVYLRQVIDVIDEIEFDDVKESHAFGFVYEEILRDLQSAGSSGEFYTPRAVTDFMALMIKPQIGEKMADFACGTGGFITSWLAQLSKQVTDTTAQKQFDDSIYGIEKKPFPYLLCVTNMLLHDIEIPNIYHMNSLKHNLLDYTDDDKFDVILMNPPYGGHEDKSIQGFFPDDLASSETADLFMSVIMHRLKRNGRVAVIVPNGFLSGVDGAKVNIKKKILTEFNLHTIVRLPSSVFSPYTGIETNILFFDNTKPTKETWFYRVDIPSDRKHFSKTKPMELKHFDECITWWNDRKEIADGEFFKAQSFTAEYLLKERGCNIDLCGYPYEEEVILDPLDTIREYQEKRAALNAEIDKTISALSSSFYGNNINKNDNKLTGACYKIDEINKRFPQDMRKSILQYAVQGKLVEQRAEEGTGRDLYQQIQEEKQKMIEEGIIKKEKPSSTIIEDAIPFDIPTTWEWCRLRDICTKIVDGDHNPPAGVKEPTDYLMLSATNINNDTLVDLGKVRYLTQEVFEVEDQRTKVEIDDIFFTIVGSMGRSCVYKGGYNICFQRSVSVLTTLVFPEFLKYVLDTPYIQFYMNANATGTAQKGFYLKQVENLVVPVPPLAEQKRIVAKIEELFQYCDGLVEY